MNTFELASEYLEEKGYKILRTNSETGYIGFRYRYNTIHFIADEDDEQYFSVSTTLCETAPGDDTDKYLEKCNHVNSNIKIAKVFAHDDTLVVTSEVCYVDEHDFDYIFERAISTTISGKIKYKSLLKYPQLG